MDKNLNLNKEQYRIFFENTLVGYFRTRITDGKLLKINQRYAELAGYSTIEECMEKFVARESYVKLNVRDRMLQELNKYGSIENYEAQIKRRDGTRIWISFSAQSYPEEGEVEGILIDVNRRKQAEVELFTRNRIASVFLTEKNENVYEKILDIILDVFESPQGVFGYISDSGDLVIPSITHSIRKECKIPDKSIVFPPSTWGDTLWGRSIRDRRPYYANREFKVPDGHIPVTAFLTVPMIFQNQVIGLICVGNRPQGYCDGDMGLLDRIAGFISPILHARREHRHSEQERKKLQKQLMQAQKMESVGRLAGGVAHDYNNKLNVIHGYTELVMEKLASDHPVQQDLKEIVNAALHSAEITRQLLAFARIQTISPEVLHLNTIIEKMIKMLCRLIGEEIDLVWSPSRQPCLVKIDPTQFDQILTNLCVNARDAIEGFGRITIETRHISLDENDCAGRPGFTPGEFVVLVVSDNGSGMNRETLDNLFEPFFTTKGPNQGTGLGLSTVYGIVKQNNGFIEVLSEPGKGSTFRLYFPRHTVLSHEVKVHDTPQTPSSRGETVLIVEDEVPILNLMKNILERLDYTVLSASTPSSALALAGEYKGDIHLLITDVVLPEMNGRLLSDQLHEIYPDLKTLYMSGYNTNAVAHRGLLDKGINFIQKPFFNRDLAMKIRMVLDRDS